MITRSVHFVLDPPAGEWRNFAGVFHRLASPLRPSPGDVARISRAIAGRDRRLLLLGVTPELARLGGELIAIDMSPRMLAAVWPGDDDAHRAMLGDWTHLPFADRAFDAVIGDGSLNSAPEHFGAVLAEVRRVLAPGGCAVFRAFCSPDRTESLAAIAADVAAGWPGNVHALKWRVAMSLAAERDQAIVPVTAILAAFDATFPDRAALAAATGWAEDEIATLDAYRGADHSLGFPTLSRLREIGAAHFSACGVHPATGYPLAERCPVIAWRAGG